MCLASGYEHNEATRPQYNEVAAEEPSPVTGLPARFYPRFYYRSKIVISTVRGKPLARSYACTQR